MTARIFISYRTADGADKATALARDLGKVFGDAAVFLDKDDLPGGSTWREAIAQALDARPVVLLLMTPALFAPERLGKPDDPVAGELSAALVGGAQVIPLLCDGLTAPADFAQFPAPFDRLGDFTWRPLRAYDWQNDVQRLLGDLAALEIHPPQATHPTKPAPARRPWAWIVATFAVALVAGWWLSRPDLSQSVAGRWQATLWQGEQVVVVLEEQSGSVRLVSEPIGIATRPDWANYRRFWLERTGAVLDAVRYTGEGTKVTAPGSPPSIDIALKVLTATPADEPVDSGNLSASLSADGRTLRGHIWMNGAQAEQPASLIRLR